MIRVRLFNVFLLVFSVIYYVNAKVSDAIPLTSTALEIRAYLDRLSKEGRIMDTIEYLTELKSHYGHLFIDDKLPSLYSFLGVALYTAKRLEESITTIKEGLQKYPNETRAWINLGEIQIQKFYLNDAAESFTNAFRQGEYSALPRIIRTKGWSLSWHNFETYLVDLERFAFECSKDITQCIIETSSGFEYTQANPIAFKHLTSLAPNSQLSPNPIPIKQRASIWRKTQSFKANKRLKVGFISSDFGIHPVATLIRGLLQSINQSKIEIFCFSLQNAISWWGNNISSTIDEKHFYILENNNLYDSAAFIASFHIEILIDLNGHTMFSGLPLFSYLPSPIQISYLGLPTTTGAQFIDYYLSDTITIPAEQTHHFSERLILMKPCYIANDYAQVQGAVALTNLFDRADRQSLMIDDSNNHIDLSKASILLASLSNSQKMDPTIFHVWMNIMQRFPGSKFLIVEYAGHEVYRHHLAKEGKYYGIGEDRLINVPQAPWIDHLFSKTAIDLVFDTISKNAHTTGLDGIWAGIPTITMASGITATARAGESIATALESDLGLVYSLKDYEDLAFSLLRKKKYPRNTQTIVSSSSDNTLKDLSTYSTPKSLKDYHPISLIKQYPLLVSWRKVIYRQRLLSPLFNTPQFTLSFEHSLQATWECASLQRYHFTLKSIAKQKYHFFPASSSSQHSAMNNNNEHEKDIAEIRKEKMIRLNQIYIEESELIPKSIVKKLKTQDLNPSQLLTDDTIENIQKYYENKRRNKFKKSSTKRESHSLDTSQQSKKVKTGRPLPKQLDKVQIPNKSSPDNQNHGNRLEDLESNPEVEDSEDTGGEDEQQKCRGKQARKIRYPAIPAFVFDGRTIMLNIGGVRNAEGWINVNSKRSNYNMDGNIDILRPMHDLKGIPTNGVAAIYSSHTLEHNKYGEQMIGKTLSEWYRVLRPGGILLISVPDLSVLARMYLNPSFTAQDRWIVTQMMYGGQADEGDYHHVGFNEELLTSLLASAGFCNITRVSAFNLAFYDKKNHDHFFDTSEKFYKGYFVSLNMIAKVCPETKLGQENMQYYDGFSINHNALPYFGDHLPESAFTQTSSPLEKKRKILKAKSSQHHSLSPQVKLSTEDISKLLLYFQNHVKE